MVFGGAKGAPMSWLASREVLPSPNHVLAKLAIFRGAEPSLSSFAFLSLLFSSATNSPAVLLLF